MLLRGYLYILFVSRSYMCHSALLQQESRILKV